MDAKVTPNGLKGQPNVFNSRDAAERYARERTYVAIAPDVYKTVRLEDKFGECWKVVVDPRFKQ